MMTPRYSSQSSLLKNEEGSLALDFVFAFTLIFGFTTIMLSLSLTLTAVEMTQYLTFTSARAYYAAHMDPPAQREQAQKKYDTLLQSDAYSFLSRGSWFVLSGPYIGDATDSPELESYKQTGGNPNRFEGAVTYFTARILSFSSPFFGSTDPDGDGSGSRFSTHVGSYLGREPTVQECIEFTKNRWKKIRSLAVAGGGKSYSTGTSDSAYTVIVDDGC
jgi:hypothetical protein